MDPHTRFDTASDYSSLNRWHADDTGEAYLRRFYFRVNVCCIAKKQLHLHINFHIPLMATTATLESNDKMTDKLYDIIRLQSLDVKIKLQRLLSKDIDRQKAEKMLSGQVDKPYSLDELCGILKYDDGLSYNEMRDEYLKGKYGV